MTELVEWLNAQLDEDELIAQAACEWPWTLHPEGDKILRHNDGTYDDWEDEELIVVETMGWSSRAARSNGLHVIRWEPSRVVADIAAKRQVLELLALAERRVAEVRRTAPEYRLVQAAEVPRDALLKAVQHLASAYAARPGYLAHWAPT